MEIVFNGFKKAMKDNLYDKVNENNSIPVASADMEDSATEEGKDDFIREWNKDGGNDSFADIIGDGKK